MGEVKVTYVVNGPTGQQSFSSWEDITDSNVRENLQQSFSEWEKKLRHAALVHLIKQEIGEEGAKQVKITFISDNDKRA